MKLKVTLVRSPIASLKKQIRTVEALGLKKLHRSVIVPDNAAMRGMVFRVRHMVTVEEISDSE